MANRKTPHLFSSSIKNLQGLLKNFREIEQKIKLRLIVVCLISGLGSIFMLNSMQRYSIKSAKIAPNSGEKIIDLQPKLNKWVKDPQNAESSVSFYDIDNDVSIAEHQPSIKYRFPELVDFPLVYDSLLKFSSGFLDPKDNINDKKTRIECLEELFVSEDNECRAATLKDTGLSLLKTSMNSYYGLPESDLENYTAIDLNRLLAKISEKNNLPSTEKTVLQKILKSSKEGNFKRLPKNTFQGFSEVSGRIHKDGFYAVLILKKNHRTFGLVSFFTPETKSLDRIKSLIELL